MFLTHLNQSGAELKKSSEGRSMERWYYYYRLLSSVLFGSTLVIFPE
jgi:hypothetical protein